MNWTYIWFIVNSLFVVSIIVYMFMHRSYAEAKLRSEDAGKLQRIGGRKRLMGWLSILLFIAMIASFLVNMKVNG